MLCAWACAEVTADDDCKFLARHTPHRPRRRGGWSGEMWLIVATWVALFVVAVAVGYSLYWR
jgi:hypothetical protein